MEKRPERQRVGLPGRQVQVLVDARGARVGARVEGADLVGFVGGGGGVARGGEGVGGVGDVAGGPGG